jgi:hypothetical protein
VSVAVSVYNLHAGVTAHLVCKLLRSGHLGEREREEGLRRGGERRVVRVGGDC